MSDTITAESYTEVLDRVGEALGEPQAPIADALAWSGLPADLGDKMLTSPEFDGTPPFLRGPIVAGVVQGFIVGWVLAKEDSTGHKFEGDNDALALARTERAERATEVQGTPDDLQAAIEEALGVEPSDEPEATDPQDEPSEEPQSRSHSGCGDDPVI